MQRLEKKLLTLRDASPIDRIAAEIAPDGESVSFRALTVCEHCSGEIALPAGFTWSEIGWYKGDYNRAQAYADAIGYAHDAHSKCNKGAK
jgi:hypothetical protein